MTNVLQILTYTAAFYLLSQLVHGITGWSVNRSIGAMLAAWIAAILLYVVLT